MQALTDIPFELAAADLLRRTHVEAGTDDASELEALCACAKRIARPKALYKECFVEARTGATVVVDGVTFTSRTLRRNLEQAERIFPFIVTCGRELDDSAPPKGDLLKDYWWDTIKAELLAAAAAHLNEHLDRKFRLGKTASMSPGAGDAAVWPIEQQRQLFALFGDARERIGVELTDSFLMIPNKTVSGIRFPTETDFRSCQVCRRANCPSRSAPFDPELWAAVRQTPRHGPPRQPVTAA